jgi:hypothetical protein
MMLLRKDGLDVIAIPQPSHAWLSGQMARAWGNAHFAAPTPYDEVCLAAGQHDISWLDWEMTPALDAGTGLPQEFFRVPSKVHITLWREGVLRARVFGHYPALLVSLHADTIYAQYFNSNKASVENAEAVRAFLDEQHRFQARTAASLRADPKLAEQASPETIEHNRLLIAAFDRMSLEICWGVRKEIKIPKRIGAKRRGRSAAAFGRRGEARRARPRARARAGYFASRRADQSSRSASDRMARGGTRGRAVRARHCQS